MNENQKTWQKLWLSIGMALLLVTIVPDYGLASTQKNDTKGGRLPAGKTQIQDLPQNRSKQTAGGSGIGTTCCQATATNTASIVDNTANAVKAANQLNETLARVGQTNGNGQQAQKLWDMLSQMFAQDKERFWRLMEKSVEANNLTRRAHDGGATQGAAGTGAKGAGRGFARQQVANKAFNKMIGACGKDREAKGDSPALWKALCDNNVSKAALGIQDVCQGGGAAREEHGRQLFNYAELCANDNKCRALGICELCDGGRDRFSEDKRRGLPLDWQAVYARNIYANHKTYASLETVPNSVGVLNDKKFIPVSMKGVMPVNFILTAGGGGGGGGSSECSPDNSALNIANCTKADNCPMDKPGGVCKDVIAAATEADTGFAADYQFFSSILKDPGLIQQASLVQPVGYTLVTGDSDSAKAVHGLRTIEHCKKVGEALRKILGLMDQALSVGGQCKEHKPMDQGRTKVGFKANSETCLSCTQMKQWKQFLSVMRDKTASLEGANTNANKKKNEAVGNGKEAVDNACKESASDATGGKEFKDWQNVELFHDPIFIALLNNRDFHRLVSELRPMIPKMYAQQSVMVAEVIYDLVDGPNAQYAQRDFVIPQPGDGDEPAATDKPADFDDEFSVPPSAHERSVSLPTPSLSGLFAASGVTISGQSARPILTGFAPPPAVSWKDETPPADQGMKAILISGHGAQ